MKCECQKNGEDLWTINNICRLCLVKWFKKTHSKEEYQVYKKDTQYMEDIYNIINL